MSSLWAYGPVIFEVNGGEISALELKVPRRGIIRAITVEQLDGANNATLQLVDSRAAVAAYLGDGASSISEPGEATDAAAAHKVTAELAITAGKLFLSDVRLPYVNRDGTNANPVRRLWALIDVPSVSGRVSYAVSLTIEQVNFS